MKYDAHKVIEKSDKKMMWTFLFFIVYSKPGNLKITPIWRINFKVKFAQMKKKLWIDKTIPTHGPISSFFWSIYLYHKVFVIESSLLSCHGDGSFNMQAQLDFLSMFT